jgi:hypothetical protein
MTNQLLQLKNIPERLRKQVEGYQHTLRAQRERWFAFLTQSHAIAIVLTTDVSLLR